MSALATPVAQLPQAAPAWIPLKCLAGRLESNLASLSLRYPELAESLRQLVPGSTYLIQTFNQQLNLGVAEHGIARPLKSVLSPASAQATLKKLCPNHRVDQPVLIAGEDLGWLWHQLYQLPTGIEMAPGLRVPIYFLIADLERFWAILHIQDWAALLADPRVRLFAGADCFQQFRSGLLNDLLCPWPALSIEVTPGIFPAGVSLSSALMEARAGQNIRLKELGKQFGLINARNTAAVLAERFQSTKPLKILGITSRYTTFIQHSMRDWLAAFDRLGHTTKLLIEPADHQVPTNLTYALAYTEFQPDLVIAIDHSRATLDGVPDGTPVLMWLQDYMPNLYTPEAGQAQGPRDYVLGFAFEKLRLVHEMGYPADRYLPSTIGVNPARFSPRSVTDPGLAKYICDVSFVTNASQPAEQILQQEITRYGTPDAKKLMLNIFEQLNAVYEAGGSVVAPPVIRGFINRAITDLHFRCPPETVSAMMDLFYLRINNALYRHQALNWLLDLNIDLRLYGQGWENNPTFKRYAQGVAKNQGELPLIYQACRINLHVSPMGSLHQRVMEGLASGGFFLLRRGDGDILGRIYAGLFQQCQRLNISTDAQLKACNNPTVKQLLQQAIAIHHSDPFADKYTFMQLLQGMHDCDYLCSAGCVWGEDFDQVSFNSRAEFQAKVLHFLNSPSQRQAISQSMLQPVLAKFTYEQTTRRALAMIAEDQVRQAKAS